MRNRQTQTAILITIRPYKGVFTYGNNVTIIIRNSMYTRYNSVPLRMTDKRYIGNWRFLFFLTFAMYHLVQSGL